jgi:hypothetical protein
MEGRKVIMEYFNGLTHIDGNQDRLVIEDSHYQFCLNFRINEGSTVVVDTKHVKRLIDYLQTWVDTGKFEEEKSK